MTSKFKPGDHVIRTEISHNDDKWGAKGQKFVVTECRTANFNGYSVDDNEFKITGAAFVKFDLIDSPEFSLGWPYGHQSRGGREVELLTKLNKAVGRTLVFKYTDYDGREFIRSIYENGRYYHYDNMDHKHNCDIINKPKPVERKELYRRVTPAYEGRESWHSTQMSSDNVKAVFEDGELISVEMVR